MAYLVTLPPLGEGIFEAQMIAVHKKAGEEVKEGDVIAEMETDKAVGVLASPIDGVIEEFYIEQYDYVFRDEKVLLIDDGKDELTSGSGADGGRVSEDGSIVAPPEDEVLAKPKKAEVKASPAVNKAEDKKAEAKEEVKESKPRTEKEKEAEKLKEDKATAEKEPQVARGEGQDDNGFQKVEGEEHDYYIVSETGSVKEIFDRFYGQEKEKASGPKVDPEFMADQGQAQQGEPKGAASHKDRYLDPLTDNFMHSLDGSQPIPTHVANELTHDEYLERAQSVKAAPAVRKYAAENKIDLTDLKPNDEGLVTKEMVDEALAHAVGEREWNYRLIDDLDPGYFTNRADEEAGREETYIRKYNASRFEMTHHKVPPFSVQVKVDMSKIKDLVATVKGDRVGPHPYTPYFIKAITIVAYRYPELNSTIDDVVSVFRFKPYVNVGIEMNTVQGLFTPVVKDAQDMSIDQIEDRVAELEDEVKVERIFNYDTNSESTITITDLSDLGSVESFVPLIHYPDAAIFGFANIRDEVVVEDGEMVIKPLQPMTLVIDARIVTRDKAVRIVNFIQDMIEDPSYLFQMEKHTQEMREEKE